jgi:Fe-S-cluster containining protein
MSDSVMDGIVKTLIPYERTKCSCSECRACCKTMPAYLGVLDIEKIAEFLGVTLPEVMNKLEASSGALVFSNKSGLRRIETIVPSSRPDGSCVFLSKDGKCKIHPVAPFGCAFFDMHMTREEGNKRSSPMLQLIEQDMVYQLQIRALKKRGQISERPEVKRQRLNALVEKLNSRKSKTR